MPGKVNNAEAILSVKTYGVWVIRSNSILSEIRDQRY